MFREVLKIQPGEVVVDIGCGSADYLIKLALANPWAQFIGIEADISNVCAAVKMAAAYPELQNLTFKAQAVSKGSLEKLFPSDQPEKVDTILLLTDVFYSGFGSNKRNESDWTSSCCDEIYRIIKYGGRIVFLGCEGTSELVNRARAHHPVKYAEEEVIIHQVVQPWDYSHFDIPGRLMIMHVFPRPTEENQHLLITEGAEYRFLSKAETVSLEDAYYHDIVTGAYPEASFVFPWGHSGFILAEDNRGSNPTSIINLEINDRSQKFAALKGHLPNGKVVGALINVDYGVDDQIFDAQFADLLEKLFVILEENGIAVDTCSFLAANGLINKVDSSSL
ncbi:MAG: methyltransferase domain-containing protein, partial [Candidatus Omnitrophica bacterium]|nr:methyltransferase domain-containing protein [Candidatus Omnitrophota bacterium]